MKGSDSEVLLACWLLRECLIGFPKMFFHCKILREGETLPHEGKVVVFGVFLPKKFKKCFSQSGAFLNSNFPTPSSLGKIMPPSHLVALT